MKDYILHAQQNRELIVASAEKAKQEGEEEEKHAEEIILIKLYMRLLQS